MLLVKIVVIVLFPHHEIDRCVLCKAPTNFEKNDPIEMRTGYVEGCGQLCSSCEKEVYR